MINQYLVTDAMIMQQIKARYDKAKAQNNTEGMEAARKSHKHLAEQIEKRGKSYAKVYQLYQEAVERGNEYIDLNDVIWEKDVSALIQSFRENGVEHFTFSSTWSSAVEIAWLFTENSCSLEGLLKINSPHKAFDSEEYEKVPAYLFAVH